MDKFATYRMYLLSECGLSELTVKGYCAYMRRFDVWLAGRYEPAVVPLAEVRDYIRTLSRAGQRSRTVIKTVNCIRAYLRFAGRDDGKDIESPKADHREYLLPNEAEVKAHIAAPSSLRDRAILALLYSSGLRERELCALKIEDVESWAEGRIRVRCGKGGKDRIIWADTVALAHVCAWLDSRPQPLYREDWLFCSAKNPAKPIIVNYINVIVARTAKRAGVRHHVTPHLCRKFFATRMLRQMRANGHDGLAWVSRLLGHSDGQSIMPYIVSDADDRKKEHNLRHPRERMARGESPEMPLGGPA